MATLTYPYPCKRVFIFISLLYFILTLNLDGKFDCYGIRRDESGRAAPIPFMRPDSTGSPFFPVVSELSIYK
jgi:hypothetical protein